MSDHLRDSAAYAMLGPEWGTQISSPTTHDRLDWLLDWLEEHSVSVAEAMYPAPWLAPLRLEARNNIARMNAVLRSERNGDE